MFWIIVIAIFVMSIVSSKNKRIENLEKQIRKNKNYFEDNEDEIENKMEILETLKKADFEFLEEKLEMRNINKIFLDEIIAKYVKKIKVHIENIEILNDLAIIETKLEKPNMDVLKYDILYEWEKLKEKISNTNYIDSETIREMGDKFRDIMNKEDIFYSEESFTVYFDKKTYGWEITKYVDEEYVYTISEFEKFMDIIAEIRSM